MPFMRQGIFLGIGAVVCIMMHRLPCHMFKYFSALWPVIFVMLVITALSGGEVNGAARWLRFCGLTIQPSEFAKGILVTTVALLLSRCREGSGVNEHAMKYVLMATLPIAIFIFKDNISTAVFLCGVVYVMMFVAGVPTKQMLALMGVGVGILVLGIVTLKSFPSRVDDPFYKTSVGSMFKRMPTAKERVFGKSLVITEDPDSLELTDRNLQVVHARMALANNNHGLGRMPGNSVERDYLPQAFSDFIFAIIVEETGLWGSGFVLLLYLVLLFRAGVVARKCGHTFGAFLVMGLGVLLVGQALLNMVVAIGLGPVTGQTLPLISRGGTSTLITCAYFGMMQSIAWSGVRQNDSAGGPVETDVPETESVADVTPEPAEVAEPDVEE